MRENERERTTSQLVALKKKNGWVITFNIPDCTTPKTLFCNAPVSFRFRYLPQGTSKLMMSEGGMGKECDSFAVPTHVIPARLELMMLRKYSCKLVSLPLGYGC